MKLFTGIGLSLLLAMGCSSQKAWVEGIKDFPEKPEQEEQPLQKKEEAVKEKVKYRHYCVILGSFANEEKALDFSHALIYEGFYTPSVISSREGLYRVAADCFEEEDEAREALVKIRRQYPAFRDAWVLPAK